MNTSKFNDFPWKKEIVLTNTNTVSDIQSNLEVKQQHATVAVYIFVEQENKDGLHYGWVFFGGLAQ